MKITDFSVTMSKWSSPAWQTATAAFGSDKLLGVLTLRTDEGVEGHAFLGSSRQGARFRGSADAVRETHGDGRQPHGHRGHLGQDVADDP